MRSKMMRAMLAVGVMIFMASNAVMLGLMWGIYFDEIITEVDQEHVIVLTRDVAAGERLGPTNSVLAHLPVGAIPEHAVRSKEVIFHQHAVLHHEGRAGQILTYDVLVERPVWRSENRQSLERMLGR
ncbi:hypothetical protein FRC96_11280 [Lujinxingia vulgaris]|uniref:Uncharacterized protein n=1 Tax=Lujinxingia vulgaris TaxID=2600176 RepID=A0A5C6X283_9DELT|nr:hypothetical protein [Lujinxingia vulgaris]TXD35255.1 hypothetical protein FRC96_11280 [Lujinxingia vulgaris]